MLPNTTAFDYAKSPIGSRDWCLFWDGWQAALAAYRATPPQAEAAQPAGEPDCWAILTPNGSKLVSPQEAKGRKDAYPLYTLPPQVQRAGLSDAQTMELFMSLNAPCFKAEGPSEMFSIIVKAVEAELRKLWGISQAGDSHE